MPAWISSRTPGVRYYEHTSRRHGRVPDRYWSIRYTTAAGQRKEEGLGWSSAGWTEEKAAGILASLRESARTGRGPQTLAELREQASAERRAATSATYTVASAIDDYIVWARSNKKSAGDDESRLRIHVQPLLGDVVLSELTTAHVEALKHRCQTLRTQRGGRPLSPATIRQILAVLRALLNHAARLGRFRGENPVSRVAMPSPENERLRYLSHEEADELVLVARTCDPELADAILLSLHTGLRLGEICALHWSDVDLDTGLLYVLDSKTGDGVAYINTTVRRMLQRRVGARPIGLVFPGPFENEPNRQVTTFDHRFKRVLDGLGWNKGVHDRRKRITFHTLRHTFASWLAIQGVSILTISKLMRHKTIAMTQRYAKLSRESRPLRDAVDSLDPHDDTPSPTRTDTP